MLTAFGSSALNACLVSGLLGHLLLPMGDSVVRLFISLLVAAVIR